MKKHEKKAIARSVRRAGDKRMRRMKVVALIPARGGSKGLLRKNIRYLAGYPLIAHSILALKTAQVDPVYVSTEDSEIKEISQIYGAKVVDRPDYLARDETSTEMVIEHFLRVVSCDVVVMVQCTSPMLEPSTIVNGLSDFSVCKYDSLFSVVDTKDVLFWDYKLKPVNYDPKRRGRRQVGRRSTYIETGALYIFKRSMFEKDKCRIGGNIGVVRVPFQKSFQVDSKTDLGLLERLMS